MNLVGKNVKIFLKNGMTAEGQVAESSEEEDELLLRTKESPNLLIIFKPSENILMLQIINQEVRPKIQEPDANQLKLDHYEPDPSLRGQKLAELRKLQTKEHRAQIREHLSSWKLDKKLSGPSYYEQPFIPQSNSFLRPSKKNQ